MFSVTAMSPSGTTTAKSNGKHIGRARLVNSSPPTVSGTAQAGLVLTTSTGSWTGSLPVVYGYQWLRCDSTGSGCAAVEGEVNSNYRLVAGDVGSTFRARVTATNASGSKSATSAPTNVVLSASSAGVPPLNTAPPTVAGTATEGLTLTASAGVWAGTAPIAYGYQWRRCDLTGSSCTDVSGRTAATYVLGADDVGKTLRISVSGTNDFGADAATSTSTPVVARAPIPPANTSVPTISGNPVVGSALHADLGTWAGSTPMTFSYQWRRCDGSGGSCVSIAGATHSDYSVVDADAGGSLRVLVTAANSIDSATSQSSATRVVPKSSVYWGAYMDGDPTYTYYYGGSWGDAPWDSNTWSKFESNAGKKVSIVHWGSGSPWTHDFKYFRGTFERVRQAGDLNFVNMTTASVPLKDVAAGKYDSSFQTWAEQAAAWGHPFFLALDIEMNGPWEPYAPGVNGNTPADYVSMWRHVHDLATQAGAGNITWVWCPNVDPNNKYTSYSQLYPGNAYVDWTCFDGYNKTGTESFSDIFKTSYQKLLDLAPTKPIMIGETSSIEGGAGKAAWVTDALTQLPTSFPQIKAVVWFNWRIFEANKWWEWPIESSPSTQQAFRAGISSPYYVPGGSFGSLPLGSKIGPP